jgi:hypothetical protein
MLSTEKGAHVLKLNREDKVYKTSLLIPTISSKLKLTKIPEFKNGGIIEGYLEFDTQDYYYRLPSNEYVTYKNDKKKRISLCGYFRTEDPPKR